MVSGGGLHWGGPGSLPGARAGDGASQPCEAPASEVGKHLAWLQEVGTGPLGPVCGDHGEKRPQRPRRAHRAPRGHADGLRLDFKRDTELSMDWKHSRDVIQFWL